MHAASVAQTLFSSLLPLIQQEIWYGDGSQLEGYVSAATIALHEVEAYKRLQELPAWKKVIAPRLAAQSGEMLCLNRPQLASIVLVFCDTASTLTGRRPRRDQLLPCREL